MCDRCDQIDKKIEKFKIVAARFTDQQMTEGLADAIAEVEALKGAVHARSRLRSSSEVNTVPKP